MDASHKNSNKESKLLITILIVLILLIIMSITVIGALYLKKEKNSVTNLNIESKMVSEENVAKIPESTKEANTESNQEANIDNTESEAVTNEKQEMPKETENQLENEKSMKAYQEFLEGKRGVFLADSDSMQTCYCVTDLQTGTEYYLLDLLKSATLNMFLYEEGEQKIKELQYAYIDCGKDGVSELAVRFYGMNIYCEDDDSDCTFVIKYKEDKLLLVRCADSWARSYETLYSSGYITGFGSGGAGDQFVWNLILDRDGNLVNIYEFEYLSGGFYVDMADEEIYQGAFGNPEKEISVNLAIYQIGDKKYYVFEEDTEYVEECKKYIELGKEKGMCFITAEEVDTLIQQRRDEMGINVACLAPVEPEWNKVEYPIYSQYVK